jgi:hypothetical protein
MERRTALKIIGAGAVAPKLAVSTVTRCHGGESPQAVAAPHVLQFFTPEENQLLDQLMEMIIPADEHSPGAHAAQVSLFADLMVSTSSEEVKRHWRAGLQLIRAEAERTTLATALENSARGEDKPANELEHFFVSLKQMTANGYYTSSVGIHQDLQYQGNTYLSEFPGCTHPEHGASKG